MGDSKQTLKECLGFWRDAVLEYNKGNNQEALNIFRQVEDPSARVLYNIACAHIRLQQHDEAMMCLSRAIQKDIHLAVAFFQRGILHLKNHSIKKALVDLQTTKTLLRGNTCIDYKPLGMFCRLHICEVLYNIAIARCLDNDVTVAKQLLTEGLHDADDRQRKLLMSAMDTIQDGRIDMLAPLYISIRNIFAPPKGVTSAFEKKNLVGKAKVVSATDVNDRDVWNGAKRAEELKQLKQCPLLAPKSPIMRIKHKIMNRYERRNTTFDGLKPENNFNHARCHSAGDLRILATSEANNLSKSTSQTQLFRNSASIGELNAKRSSMGNLFGNYLTVVNQALTMSCDVLTSIATPSDDENNTPSPIENKPVIFGLGEETTRDSKDVNHNLYTKKPGTKSPICLSLECLTETLQPETNTNENEQNSTIVQAEIENCNIRQLNASKVAHKHDVVKTRPPPPSYPPPPLPPKIIITL